MPARGELLTDPDLEVRRSAIFALGRIGPTAKSAVPDLVAALKDPDEEIHAEAARALKRIDPEAAARAGVP